MQTSEPTTILNPVLRELISRIPCSLTLEDGTVFKGYSFGAPGKSDGEVVFSTSMVGYPESLTDPSYRGQLLCLTYPMIGNYGVPSKDETTQEGVPKFFESDRIQVRGLIVHENCTNPSHHQSTRTLEEWLRVEKIPAIYGVDTRRLARVLRERGVMLGAIAPDNVAPDSREVKDPNKLDLVGEVSTRKPVTYAEGRETRIAVIDCGVKYGIIRNLLQRKATVIRMPYNVTSEEVMNVDPSGIVVSNGPGNPKTCRRTIMTIQELIEIGVPMFGICLGNQLIALAEGADTYKMKYGHRSQNQPVLDVETGRCYITTQNHGYAVDKTTLEKVGLDAWFVNANDQSIEGIRHPKKTCWGVQWHPEASPGPTDTGFLFDLFVKKAIEHAQA